MDNGQLGEEQELCLVEAGYETESVDGVSVIKSLESHLLDWQATDEVQDDGD